MAGLSKQAIFDYQQIYKKEFGQEISFEEAREQGTKLLRLFNIIYQPIPKAWLVPQKKQNKKRKKNKTI